MKKPYGKVHIVGAGPGSPELITLRGAECLKKADVVLYDRLAHPALLFHVSAHAKLIYCGKKPCLHTLRQEDIQNELIVQAKRGKNVVRLKGGDPSVFGRLAEEMKELSERQIPYEIIPGITAGSAAASYAGVSLTHRDYAHGYRVLTGHGKTSTEDIAVDWHSLAHTTDTLIWYMGMKRLPQITAELMKHGKEPKTNVLVVEWATHKQQRTIPGTLDTISDIVLQQDVKNPSIIIIGDVTSHHTDLQWFAPSTAGSILAFPLHSKEVSLYEKLQDSGIEVFLSSFLSEDSDFNISNTLEIIDRLVEEGFIRHMILPATIKGKQLYEAWQQRHSSIDKPLTCWMAEENETSIISSLLPSLPIGKPEDSIKCLLAEEVGHPSLQSEKATV
ncbi:uroporphyrinogen-III C-methyltransferase [Salibacterium salarium]|uniref:Uroporphyrinogen-III C-methyltransferase n=1 Tax=Salibacterium salarium TaxID=284579 RepID=A0A3R9P852_9BACI|nr:uroporphyrinogen-III C-methyltransferase [Salibacterium salarium]RSL34959.1 uroporphyrinogen-III C-methyltransferase [Salibacterium salarium]